MSQSISAAPRRSRASKRVPARRKFWRVALITLATLCGAAAALWVALHRYDWMGPLVANTLRSIIGVDAVAKLEDFTYAVEDRVNRLTRRHEAPKTYWSVPPTQSAAKAEAEPAPQPVKDAPVLRFRPKDPGPALKQWSAPGDGVWVPIVDSRYPQEEPFLYKTLLHPDAGRSWSEAFVVAIDLRRVDVYVVAGSQEPKADDPKTVYERRARIPDEHHETVLAAFNGGFMTEHGGYGMKVDGIVLVHPKPSACTLALYKDGTMRIASWSKLAAGEADMVWYRQAPQCMYEAGKIHPGLTAGSGLKWGATLDGDTVIRRSAVGLSADREILYVSITNHTSARALADAMRHAGAVDVAQMDVNWSYPKFVLYEADAPGQKRKAVALASGFEFSEDEYIRKRARRDFFYAVRRNSPRQATP
ncbi:MAG: phosphodiester glycosidase family protein [Myxococcota bacterium]